MFNPIKKHISQYLAVIFLLPIVFQPLHIIGHHCHVFVHEHSVLQSPVKNLPDIHSIIEKHSCPICHFQFSVGFTTLNKCDVLTNFSFETPTFNTLFTQIQVFHKSSSRAPPLLFL